MSRIIEQQWNRSVKAGQIIQPDFESPPIGQLGLIFNVPARFHKIVGWNYSFESNGAQVSASRIVFYQGRYFDNGLAGSAFPIFGRGYENPPINGLPVFLDIFLVGYPPPIIAFCKEQFLEYEGQLTILVVAPLDQFNSQTNAHASFTLFGYEK